MSICYVLGMYHIRWCWNIGASGLLISRNIGTFWLPIYSQLY